MANLDGTSGTDIISGTAGDDIIRGFGGSDQLEGLGGNDTLYGGDDWDSLYGGDGDDRLEGGAGHDYLVDGLGNDYLDGGDDGDTIDLRGGGDDIAFAGSGEDRIDVGHSANLAGHVQVDAGTGNDLFQLSDFSQSVYDLSAGEGDDRLILSSLWGLANISLGAGRDTVELTDFFGFSVDKASIIIADFTPGDSGDRIEFLELIARNFSSWNQAQSPFATGHARLIQNGADTLLQFDPTGGGDSYRTLITFKNVSAAAFTAANLDGYNADGSIPAALDLDGTEGRDTLSGRAGNDVIDGLGDGDVIKGGGGDDLLRGGGGVDTLYGQVGNDEIHGGDDPDNLDGGYGNDIVYGDGGDDWISSVRGNDTLYGGDGADTISLDRGSITVETVSASGEAGDDRIYIASHGGSSLFVDGGAGNDLVSVSVLFGSAQVTLGSGADRLVLADGIPSYLATSGHITVTDFAPGAGDTIDLNAFAPLALIGWDGSANPFGSEGYFRLIGSGGDTLLQIDRNGGGDGFRTFVTFQNVQPSSFTTATLSGFDPAGTPPPPQILVGTEGNDNLIGGGGNDTIDLLGGEFDQADGRAGDDIVRGGAGLDILRGGTGNDRLEGGGGDDQLDGGYGNDLLIGGEGSDFIQDTRGSDTLYGGAGDDKLFLSPDSNEYNQTYLAFGEDGADTVTIRADNALSIQADAGAGDDHVILGGTGTSLSLTLGSGSDSVQLDSNFGFYGGGQNRIADFNAAPGGDAIQPMSFLLQYLSGWDGSTNPFDTGYARLVQQGADTLVQFDRNGAAQGFGFQTFLILAGVDSRSLGAANIGFDVQALFGGSSNDVLVGDGSDDRIDGGDGNDQLSGLGGADRLDGGLGNDLLDGGAGADTMRGGFHDDLYYVDDAGDVVIELFGEGLDEVRTSLDGYSLLGGNVETLTATTNTAHDLRGGTGDNVLTGAAGNDLLRLNDGGNDGAFGGAGSDVLYFGQAFTGADVADGGADRDVVVLQGNYALTLSATNLVGVESLSLQSGARTTWGDTANNFYDYTITTHDANLPAGQQLIVNGQTLRAGEDFSFDGSAETDGFFLVYGGHGVDTLKGGAGNDAFFFEGARFGPGDRVDGGAGRDALIISAGNGVTHIEFGATSLTSIESISLNARYATDPTARPSYELVLDNGNVAAGANLIVNGNSLADRLQSVGVDGSAVHDGSLSLIGGFGNDTLIGGSGGDLLQGGEGMDVLTGGGGADIFRYAGPYDATSQVPDRITDFTSGVDRIDLGRIDADAFAAGDQAFRWIGAEAFTGSAGELRAYEYQGSWYVEGDMDGNGAADLVLQLTSPPAPIVQGDFLL